METIFPLKKEFIKENLSELNLGDLTSASIREIVRITNVLQRKTGQQFVRMEMGVPGLTPENIGIEAEIKALKEGVAGIYPPIEGITELKEASSEFINAFLNVKISPNSIVPTVGTMQAAMAAFLVTSKMDQNRTKTLFIDPGFPVQKQQHHVLGIPYEHFDLYHYRGEKLHHKLDEVLSKGDFSSLIYSNPNNPSWICLNEEELEIIGDLSIKHQVVVIEDLAYFGMDFREDYSHPGIPPFQPTVANYCDRYMLMISSSKVFSYAGQRIGILAVSDALFSETYVDLLRNYQSEKFGLALIYGALYSLSAGTSHSAQFAMTALLKGAVGEKFNLLANVHEYEKRAKKAKNIFLKNGFKLVYETDLDQPLADGFYFTICYPGMSGDDLILNLLRYGISSIGLQISGSSRTDGIRACTSQLNPSAMNLLSERLAYFASNQK